MNGCKLLLASAVGDRDGVTLELAVKAIEQIAEVFVDTEKGAPPGHFLHRAPGGAGSRRIAALRKRRSACEARVMGRETCRHNTAQPSRCLPAILAALNEYLGEIGLWRRSSR